MRPHLTLAMAALSLLGACNLQDPAPPTDAKPADMGMDTPQDVTDMVDMCTPRTCEDFTGEVCGMQEDGCGAMIECGPCGCDPDDLEGTCASQACQVATGCGQAGECQYEPVTCSGLVCACPAGQDCENEPVRCTDACPAVACDASPMMVDGKVVFQNLCVDVSPASCQPQGMACGGGTCDDNDICQPETCGVCDLGQWSCDQTAPVCEPLELGGLDASAIDCDASIRYVDSVVGSTLRGDGSKEAPFESIGQVLAAPHGVKMIILAGSPRVEDLEQWGHAISLYGGFRNDAGVWVRDSTQRPVFSSTVTSANGSKVGLKVESDAQGIVFSGIRIESPDAGVESGAGSIALSIRGGNVTLHDVELVSGAGAPGMAGTAGVDGAAGRPGGNAGKSSVGLGGENVMCSNANGGAGGGGGEGGAVPGPGRNGAPSVTGIAGGLGGTVGNVGAGGSVANVNFTAKHGAAGVFGGTLDNHVWTPSGGGAAGIDGSDGLGGGGGGGGGGTGGGGPLALNGGSGGGGGAGGCGGSAGTPGQPGGASIALALEGATVTVMGGTWTTGQGGAGGDGGLGGQGGAGGAGGQPSFLGSAGGAGGQGVDGGPGGDGGPGAGGPSHGALCAGASMLTVMTMPNITLGGGGMGGGNSVVRGAVGASEERSGCP